MALYKLALALHRSPSEFLIARQPRPPMPPGNEYQAYSDSDLLDLPSTILHPIEGDPRSDPIVISSNPSSNRLDLHSFDFESALEKALSQVGLGLDVAGEWEVFKYVEEPEFGPAPPVHTVFVRGRLLSGDVDLKDMVRWVDASEVLKLLSRANLCCDRIGPLVSIGLLFDPTSAQRTWEVPSGLCFQEYPPGVMVIPMQSQTKKPYWTTNLVVITSKGCNDSDGSTFFSSGEAVIVDPGCRSDNHSQLAEVILTLPKKLLVFVTHHHIDHIDGLSVVQKCNPDAILLGHENTLNHIGKDKWSIDYKTVCGGEKISIGDQQLEVIFAPGHTDGHIALRHVGTNSLIVGDHCVGQGSAALDVSAGGNMKDYFLSTYKFMELSPYVIIPMHGRINVWPKQMLCGYLKNRRDRELSILKAIEGGSRSLYDIVSSVYYDVDAFSWIPASSNVKLHVEYLACQGKLPKAFSMDSFYNSYDAFLVKLGVAGTSA